VRVQSGLEKYESFNPVTREQYWSDPAIIKQIFTPYREYQSCNTPLESTTANKLALKENGSKNLRARETPDQTGQEQDRSTPAKPETKANKDTKNLACSLEKNKKKESVVGSLETK
jgi:hypothetical protein